MVSTWVVKKLQYTILTVTPTGTKTNPSGALSLSKLDGVLSTKVPSGNSDTCTYVLLPTFCFLIVLGTVVVISSSHGGAVTS